MRIAAGLIFASAVSLCATGAAWSQTPATKGTAAPAAGKAKEGSRLAAMAQKIAGQGYDSPYRLRKQTVEPVFGQIKQARGFRQFLLRGLDKVKQEWVLVCTAHNLLKLTSFGWSKDDLCRQQ